MTFSVIFLHVCVCLRVQGCVGWLVGVLSLERPSQLGHKAILHTAPRYCAAALISPLLQSVFVIKFLMSCPDRGPRVAHQQREGFPTSLLFFNPSSIRHLRSLLPGRRSQRPRSSPLRQGLHHLAQLRDAEQSLLPPGSRETKRLAVAVSADRPPTPLSAAGKESSPL